MADLEASMGELQGVLSELAEEMDFADTVEGTAREFAGAHENFTRLGRAVEDAEAELEQMAEGTAEYNRQLKLVTALGKQYQKAESERLSAVKGWRAALDKREAEEDELAKEESRRRNKTIRTGIGIGRAFFQGGVTGGIAAGVGAATGETGTMIANVVAEIKRYFESFQFLPDVTKRFLAVMTTGMESLGRASKAAVSGMTEMAGGGVLAALSDVGGQMSQFVGALNPAAVQMFQFVMKDLTAVIGVALQPAFTALGRAARQAGEVLFPLAQELAPVFGEIAEVGLRLLAPVLQTFAQAVRAVLPLVQFFGEAISALVPVFRAYQAVLTAAWTTLGQFLSGFFKGASTGMDAFQKGMVKLANWALIAAGALAKLAGDFGVPGAKGFLGNLIKALEGTAAPRRDNTGLGAATGGRTTSIEGFASSQLSAAFTAAAGFGKPARKPEDLLAESLEMLKKIEGGQVAAGDVLKEQVGVLLAALEVGLKKWLTDLQVKLFKEAHAATEGVIEGASIGTPAVAGYDYLRGLLRGGGV